MWIYLALNLVLLLIYFIILFFSSLKKSDNVLKEFWTRGNITLIIIGVGFLLLNLYFYFSKNYGFLILSTFLIICYYGIEIIVIRNERE
jgi:hypothetical protein